MNQRTCTILEAAIREFIHSGDAISSQWLFDHYEFGIRPAMIRAELNDLTERGFLEQPHHSAGRVPSDKGYEFFAERTLQDAVPSTASWVNELVREQDWPSLLEKFSRSLGALSVVSDAQAHDVRKDGLDRLIDNLEWETKDEIKQVIRDFEEIEARLERAQGLLQLNDFLEVFIGRKSPLTRSQQLAVVAGDYFDGERQVFLFVIGPKRMNYEKTASLFQSLKRLGRGEPLSII